MRGVFYAALTILIITTAAGFWLQSLGMTVDGFGFPKGLWPLGFLLFGGVVFLAITTVNRQVIATYWRTKRLQKSELRPAFGLLIGPLMAFLLLGLSALSYFDLAYKERIMMALAAMEILIFVIMGNYAATLRFKSPGGLRTPWTLRDEHVWTRTHRYLGRGIFLWSVAWAALLPFVPLKVFFCGHLATMIAVKISAIILSWRLWRSMKRMSAS